MATAFRWMVRIFIALAVLTLAAMVLAYYFATRSLPEYEATKQVDGISGQVEIVRNTHAIPHIFAENQVDVYFGLGYAHAQDRLWQMTMLRRTAQGRLSELFGERTLKIDDLLRRLDLYTLANQSYKYQSIETQQALQAYSNGVNAWIKTVQTEALGRGAPEFFLFEPQIAAWTPTDSLAILRIMALQLSDHLKREVLRAQVALTVGPDLLEDILPDAPGSGLKGLPDFASLFPNNYTAQSFEAATFLNPSKPVGLAGASNAWAATGNRTTSGHSLLATDPHLGLTAPTLWMLARLEFEDGGVIGGTIPGIPAILVGRSDVHGWGVTTAYLDDTDVYIEQLNPENDAEYLTPEGYKPFETRGSVVVVKDASPVTLDLRWTENGPVLPAKQFDLGTITPPGHVTSIAWTALEAKDRSMTAAIGVMTSRSVDEALLAAQDHTAPAQNLIIADRNSIALQTVGKMPRRNTTHQSQGRIPSQGWLPQNRWSGTFPYSDNPSVVNPIGGIVANTNNKTTDAPFPKHVSHSWGDTQRINRLTKLLNDRKVHTRDSFIEIQSDQISFTARALLPLIAKDLWYSEEPTEPGSKERQRAKALNLLADWNGEMSEHLPEPLIYTAWLRHLQRKLAEDELGALAEKFPRPDPVFIERVYRNIDGAAQWCDVKQSTRAESCQDIAQLALDLALQELSERYGAALDSWRWGTAHQAHHDHEVLGTVPFLAWMTNIRQETSGGDNTIQRARTSGTGATPYANVHAGGFRAVYDFSDPESSVFISATGQSGHFLSRHYDDLAALWRRGEYIPMTLDPALARAGGDGVTLLQPRTE